MDYETCACSGFASDIRYRVATEETPVMSRCHGRLLGRLVTI